MEIEIDITKSVTENAQVYFERAKKLKKKIKGAEEALAKIKKQLEQELKKKDLAEQKHDQSSQKEESKKEWYEKFRWFYSSEGFLCIGGRDATSNEIIIKKHAQKDDIVFHTDMAGSPFFVIKTEGKNPSEATMQEAADATCSFSRAWKMGLATTNVFYVNPDQVTKEPNPGEYLAKGAFVIRGKTNYMRNKINMAIGDLDGKVMAGPFEAVKKHCKKFVVIIQGDDKPSVIAKKVKSKTGGDVDDIIRALPSGGLGVGK